MIRIEKLCFCCAIYLILQYHWCGMESYAQNICQCSNEEMRKTEISQSGFFEFLSSIKVFPEGVNTYDEVFLIDTFKNQIIKTYLLDGHLLRAACYLDTLCNGTFNEFYLNGKPKYSYCYQLGILNGLSIFYNYKGKIDSTIEYSNGKLDGEVTWYNKKGTPEFIFIYSDLDSTSYIRREFYSRRGVKISDYSYKNGIKNGKAYLYRRNGSLRKIIEYKEGLIISTEDS